jgi:hypothetical protein
MNNPTLMLIVTFDLVAMGLMSWCVCVVHSWVHRVPSGMVATSVSSIM